MKTYKQMCEVIQRSGILNKEGSAPSAEQIFNYSATGELHMIHIWYFQALNVLDELDEDIPKMDLYLTGYMSGIDLNHGDYAYVRTTRDVKYRLVIVEERIARSDVIECVDDGIRRQRL